MPALIVLAPPCAGVRFPLNPEGTTTIGRGPDCGIILSEPSLSRQHAKIRSRRGRFFIEDCHSTNGTFLNGCRLESMTPLHDGDVINLYDLPLGFSLMDESAGDDGTTDKHRLPNGRHQKETDESVPLSSGSPGLSILKGRLDSLISAARLLGSSLDTQDVSRRVLDVLFSMFPQAHLGELHLLNDSGGLDCVITRQSRSPSGVAQAVHFDRLRLEEALASGEGILSNDIRAMDQTGAINDAISSICVPVQGATQHGIGVLALGTNDEAHQFKKDDLELVSAVAVLAGQAVSFAKAHQILLQLERTQRHMEAAREIQLNMVRRSRPTVQRYRFADHYRAAERVGGDYYFYETLPDGRVILGIADASGKGLAAAMAISRFAGEVRFRIATSPTLKKAMFDLNSFVAETSQMSFITCCVCVLDPRANSLTIANAGHLPPLRRRLNDDEIETIASPRGGLPLGILEESICHPVTVPIRRGDRILFVTDGATEAMNPGNDLYGFSRLKRAMQCDCKSLDEYVTQIVDDIDSFRRGRAVSDDMCLVALERTVA